MRMFPHAASGRRVIVRAIGMAISFVTSLIVRLPRTRKRLLPFASTRVLWNRICGYFSTSKNFADFKSRSRNWLPVSIDATSMMIVADDRSGCASS